jgi:hypothetical protein
MNNGVLIYAHNSRDVDYLDLAIISARLAKKNLKVPVSLVTDKSTMQWAVESNKMSYVEDIFQHVIFSENFYEYQYRRLHDGKENFKDVLFLNKDRCSAWNLTPYDRTLLIDSDFLIFTSELSNYWNVDQDFLIAASANDFYHESRLEYNDNYISDVSIKMRWATTIMFTKNKNSKLVFDLVEFIRDNYYYFSELYRCRSRTFRNDIAFSIASHILNSNLATDEYFLPSVSSSFDKDLLIDIKQDKLFFLLSSKFGDTYTLCSKKYQDIHVMNKQSIVRNKDKLLGL